jgi:hypothetical protein
MVPESMMKKIFDNRELSTVKVCPNTKRNLKWKFLFQVPWRMIDL